MKYGAVARMGIKLQNKNNVPATNTAAHDTAEVSTADTRPEDLTEPKQKFEVGGAEATGIEPHQLAGLEETFIEVSH